MKFVCDDCGEEFKSGRSDSSVDQEAKSMWNIDNASESVKQGLTGLITVCDNCFYKHLGGRMH
jgi:hypothetical protein